METPAINQTEIPQIKETITKLNTEIPIEQTTKETIKLTPKGDEYVTKRLAAFEVYSYLKKFQFFTAIISAMYCMTHIFYGKIGTISLILDAAFLITVGAFFYFITKKANNLKERYNLQ